MFTTGLNKTMRKHIILGQRDSRFPNKRTSNGSLCTTILDQACKLRADAFLDADVIKKDALTSDGLMKDAFDSESIQFVCLAQEEVVGTARMTTIIDGKKLRDPPLMRYLVESNLQEHQEVLRGLLERFRTEDRRIVEISRLVIKKDYRAFHHTDRSVIMELLALFYFYMKENAIHDAFVLQGNKKETGQLYSMLGFRKLKNAEGKPLASFLDKYGDESDLMHLECHAIGKDLIELAEEYKQVYYDAEMILP